MITDKNLILTGASGQNFQATGLTTDWVDLTAANRGSMGDGEDLYAVWHLTAPPTGNPTYIQFQLRAGDTVDGSGLTGGVVSLAQSRVYTTDELGYTQITPNSIDAGTDEFRFTAPAAHGLVAGDALYITTTTGGTLPTITGFTNFRNPVYVVSAGLTAQNFRVSASPGGPTLDITAAGTGTGYRRATAGTGLGVSPAFEVCINPDALSKGYRYLQGYIVTDGTLTQWPLTCAITHCPTDNQRYRVYPTSIVAS